MLEGSQIPAELRMNQLMARLDETSPVATEAEQSLHDPNQVTDPKSFQAMVTMMQSQMMGEAFASPDDKNNSNPMGMNPMMMGMSQMNPQMLQMMMMQGGSGMMGMNNPMSMMMGMNPMSGMNPMMMQGMTQAFPGSKQEMVFPLKGRVSSEYGHRHHPIHGHDHFHSGVDIAAPKGSPIRMPYDGRVVFVGEVAGFGENTVIVAHENQVQADGKILYSVFGHNEYSFVKEGERVKAGEIFATVGSEGNSTGPHLHWETRVAPVGISGTEIFNQNLSMTVDPMSFA